MRRIRVARAGLNASRPRGRFEQAPQNGAQRSRHFGVEECALALIRALKAYLSILWPRPSRGLAAPLSRACAPLPPWAWRSPRRTKKGPRQQGPETSRPLTRLRHLPEPIRTADPSGGRQEGTIPAQDRARRISIPRSAAAEGPAAGCRPHVAARSAAKRPCREPGRGARRRLLSGIASELATAPGRRALWATACAARTSHGRVARCALNSCGNAGGAPSAGDASYLETAPPSSCRVHLRRDYLRPAAAGRGPREAAHLRAAMRTSGARQFSALHSRLNLLRGRVRPVRTKLRAEAGRAIFGGPVAASAISGAKPPRVRIVGNCPAIGRPLAAPGGCAVSRHRRGDGVSPIGRGLKRCRKTSRQDRSRLIAPERPPLALPVPGGGLPPGSVSVSRRGGAFR
jgi:hypothetical protein